MHVVVSHAQDEVETNLNMQLVLIRMNYSMLVFSACKRTHKDYKCYLLSIL